MKYGLFGCAFRKTFINILLKEHYMDEYIGFIYETTNNITGKKYIGSHHGDDSAVYFGSGVELQKDLKVYGTNNFSRVTLEKVKSINDLPVAESKWLESVDAKNNPLYYNRTNSAGVTYKKPTPGPDRGICPICNQNPVAINYKSNDKVRYRKLCTSCTKKGKTLKADPPAWYRAGYKKKSVCDKCGFRAKYPAKQMTVFYVDGNLRNNNPMNLKSVCLNCRVELANSRLPWKEAPLTPDF